jgi:amino acid adenylation domain-containing protein/non-ribosomal peptide synthase protein (TIGR01720 family)
MANSNPVKTGSFDLEYGAQKNYWLTKLAGPMERIGLSNHGQRENVLRESRAAVAFHFPKQLAERLLEVAKGSNLSLYVILVAAFKIIMHRYTGVTFCAVGSPVYMPNFRNDTFNEIVVLRDRIIGTQTFKDVVLQVRNTCLEAYRNQDYPFGEIVKALKLENEALPLFDNVCLLKNIHAEEFVKGFRGDLKLCFGNHEGEITLELDFAAGLLSKDAVERFGNNYIAFLDNALGNMERPIAELKAIADKEEAMIRQQFNHPGVADDPAATVTELFETAAGRVPEGFALVSGNRRVTYRELNEKANRLAAVLRRNGVGPASIVGMMMERSVEAITAILAVLKAGGAYLPLDTESPRQRVLQILGEAKVKVLLVGASVKGFAAVEKPVQNTGVTILFPEEIMETPATETGLNCRGANQASDLAYVCYTSGSTGKPKGVMVEHRSVVNLVGWFCQKYDLATNNRILHLTKLTFDVSVEEIFGSLVAGATLFIPDPDTIVNRERIRRYIEENKISIAQFVPVTLREYLAEGPQITALKKVICGGDRLDKQLNNQIIALGYELFNHYGPTETTVDALTARCELDRIVLGTPLDNVQAYIVDSYLNLQPIGIPGEICIAGIGLARGYLGEEQMTRTAFIANPFETGTLLYRTGDLGRWLPDGQIEFCGRRDRQVKIRGFRIEVAEIEYWLKNHPGVKEAIVTLKEDAAGNKSLCAYLTGLSGIKNAEIKAELSQHLPQYMIPAYLINVKAFPLNSNGKVDIKALPDPESFVQPQDLTPEDAPRNAIEADIAAVWAEVLGGSKVSIRDDFFDVGGDSIKAIQIVSRLQKKQMKIDIRDLFTYRTIADLSSHVKVVRSHENEGNIQGAVPLTPIQKWFFSQNFSEINHWNQAVMLFREQRFDQKIVKAVLEQLIQHHDALRISYNLSGTKVLQYNNRYQPDSLELKVVNLTNDDDCKAGLDAAVDNSQKSLDLKVAPLLAATVLNLPEGDYLLLVIHHLVVDGISFRIILEDFATAYRQLQNNEAIKLQAKTTSFMKWARQLYQYASSEKLAEEINYWRMLEKTEVPSLPREMAPNSNKIRDSRELSVSLSVAETDKFITEIHRAYNTEANDILLTALGMAVKKWAGIAKVLINLEGHGREAIAENIDLSRTVGWFTTEFPVILDLGEAQELSCIIKSVKELLRGIPGKGFGYGVLKYLLPREHQEGLTFKLQPRMGFNYLGRFDLEMANEVFQTAKFVHAGSVGANNERVIALDLYAIVIDNRLRITCNYNHQEYSEVGIRTLMEHFRNELAAIINHCAQKQVKEVTPSDLGYGKLSLDELEKIKKQLNKH